MFLVLARHLWNASKAHLSMWTHHELQFCLAEVQSEMMRNTIVGKVDDETAMISTEVFNLDMVGQFMTSDDFKQMEKELGLSHEVYQLTKN